MKKEKEEKTLEDAFSELEGIVEKLESPELSLEDSFLAYKEGMQILKYCNDEIDKVEKKVLVIDAKGNLDEL